MSGAYDGTLSWKINSRWDVYSMIRKATIEDLSRIAEIQIFNYRLYYYPIFKADKYYFEELQVPSLMLKYETDVDNVYVYDDGVVKGFIKIEGN